MPMTGKVDIPSLIPTVWSKTMYDELRNSIVFANIFSRDYEGEIQGMGDTVKVNQIAAPTGEILTDDEASFATELLVANSFTITVNKRASAAFEISDLAKLQSIDFQMQAQEALVYAIRKQLESDIITALVPSAAAPDHQIAPAAASDLAAVDLATLRTLLSVAKVPVANRYLCLDPAYYGDLLTKTQVMSRDFTAGNDSMGGVMDAFMGFKILEHNLLPADVGFAVHPSALQLVMQKEISVKISDLHPTKKYGYLVSADFVYGFQLFDNKRIAKISG
jgi:hypothetical protein